MANRKKSNTRSRKKNPPVSVLAEPIDSMVTPWLLVTLLLVTGVFVVLQAIT